MALCSECPNEVTGRAKTCSDACRAKRHRRLKRDKLPSSTVDLPDGAVAEAVNETVREAIAPIVREALTDDVLRSIAELVKLTPMAIAAIKEDLESDNEFIRQGAYRLLARYTLGHPALVPEMESDKQVVVLIDGVARPQGPAQLQEHLATPGALETIEGEAVETRTCDSCGFEKPAKEFVGSSHRCTDCFTRARDQAHAITAKQ